MIAVDTNILVYALDQLESVKHEQAVAFLESIGHETQAKVIPWQVACELLAWMRRNAAKTQTSQAQIHADITAITTMFALISPTHNVLQISLGLTARYSLSHWDSLLIAACIEAGVDTLYSEDMGDGSIYETVTVVNPLKPTARL